MENRPKKPRPTIDGDSAPFWSAAREGRLAIPRCKACDRYHFYPRALCPHCHSADVHFTDVSGRGTIYSYTIHRRPAGAEFTDDVPYTVALIDLEEGARMLSRVVSPSPDQVRIGDPVRVKFLKEDEAFSLPVFEVAR